MMVESIITKATCIYCLGEGRIFIHTFTDVYKNVDCPYCDGTGYEEEKNNEEIYIPSRPNRRV